MRCCDSNARREKLNYVDEMDSTDGLRDQIYDVNENDWGVVELNKQMALHEMKWNHTTRGNFDNQCCILKKCWASLQLHPMTGGVVSW